MFEFNTVYKIRYLISGPEILAWMNLYLKDETINEIFYSSDIKDSDDKPGVKYMRSMKFEEFGSDYECKFWKIVINKKTNTESIIPITGLHYYWKRYFSVKSNIMVKTSYTYMMKDPLIKNMVIDKYYLGTGGIFLLTFNFYDTRGFDNYSLDNLDIAYRRVIKDEVSTNDHFKYDLCYTTEPIPPKK